MAKAFKVRLKRSTIGSTQTQKDTVRCLGLRKVNSVNVVPDNPAMRGQIMKVQHLLEVTPEK
ncbi:MAG: 50S ribosomal protein L30 [Bdellovibrionales bacterium]|nr:50S ribosomal protein L30 [Bdellovibrionales bacterium]